MNSSASCFRDDENIVNHDDFDDSSACQLGNEKTGRWTRKEHEAFLEGINKYGKVNLLLCPQLNTHASL